jgi:hypothetical protein
LCLWICRVDTKKIKTREHERTKAQNEKSWDYVGERTRSLDATWGGLKEEWDYWEKSYQRS